MLASARMTSGLPTLDHLVRRHEAGTILFREGDRGAQMFVIRSGRVNIWKRIGETEIVLRNNVWIDQGHRQLPLGRFRYQGEPVW